MAMTLQIAIDGPVGAGKSTVAKILAERLKILYVDTGAMYRATALFLKRKGVDWGDETRVAKELPKIEVELQRPSEQEQDGRKVTVKLNGEDVSWEIRKAEIGEGASVVSQYRAVREKLVAEQQRIAEKNSVVMEGRDIGTKVLPKAGIKVYMDAAVIERAKRKQVQLSGQGEKITLASAKKDVMTRDAREMGREIDPLRPARDATILDTTGLSIEQVVDRILELVERKGTN